MANPHFEIKITKRSKRQSAVAGAAYQSGENLFSEYDQKHKDYRKKEGVVYTEIMLPSHAPPEYADREQLWNAVEAVENQWNSQLARRFVLALPREVPEELYPQMVQDYCNQFFVSKGMIVDFAIHDPKPPGHNPHCHVMLTMRAMDEHGKWLPKARKIYDLDENGERIRLPSGNWKSHKEDTVDWNEQYHGQEWRTGWETVQNRYLEMVNSPVRVDLRSYEKQGLDIIPTVHMGAAVTQMERRGIQTNIGNLNRDIKAANRMMSVIRSTIQNLRDWISDILEARKELLAENKPETASPDLINLLRDYLNLRKAERRDWSRYGQQKGATKDLQSFVNATNYLKDREIFTLEQLDSVLEEVKQKSGSMLIVQDQIWGRVTQNRSQGKATWYFCDEFHLLLREEQTAAFSCEIWKRFRKWGGIPTGATQNVKDLLFSPEIENILENSDFICLLNQASGDRKILAERLNISPQQLRYVDNSEPGEGLLIYENVILPFKNPIPKNTQLYQIMTTRLGEGATV